jgi:hypothetical protein
MANLRSIFSDKPAEARRVFGTRVSVPFIKLQLIVFPSALLGTDALHARPMHADLPTSLRCFLHQNPPLGTPLCPSSLAAGLDGLMAAE